MFLKKYLALILAFYSCLVFAQQTDIDKKDDYVRAAFNYGIIVQQHNSVGQLVNGNIWGLELNYIKPQREINYGITKIIYPSMVLALVFLI